MNIRHGRMRVIGVIGNGLLYSESDSLVSMGQVWMVLIVVIETVFYIALVIGEWVFGMVDWQW